LWGKVPRIEVENPVVNDVRSESAQLAENDMGRRGSQDSKLAHSMWGEERDVVDEAVRSFCTIAVHTATILFLALWGVVQAAPAADSASLSFSNDL
jgi:hypothetical protein